MRILILGGAGFIGSHLTERLRLDGHSVTVVDDYSRGTTWARGEVLPLDLTTMSAWGRLTVEWEQVYMLAAVVGVANVERDPMRALHTNAMSVMRLLEWLPPSARLFFASTSEVYAGSVMAGIAPVPTPERVPLSVPDVSNPRFVYAASKILGEAAVLHSGANAVIGRFHNVYGPRMGMDHAIPAIGVRMLEMKAGGRRICPIYGCEQRRSFCYIDDAVEAMVRLMDTDFRGVVNIGNDEEMTVEEAAGEIAAALDLDSVMIERLPAPAGSVDRRCPDLTLLRSLTGYEPKVALMDGVKRTMDWYSREERNAAR